ncbi:MAG: alpha/beta fold hydrolase [Alicyclobacillaceae bacterium]|nr:alpha/beta fold hydrolase [Alicyclobacillaceae bacterium]
MQQAIELHHRGRVLRGMRHAPGDRGARQPAVIMYHSFASHKVEPHRMYVKLSRALAGRGIHSFRFDFSGSGESDGNFEDMTVSGEVEEAHAILDMVRRYPGIDPDQIALLGFSLGGVVASLVAADRPADVAKLVLIAPAANMPEVVRELAEQAAGAARPQGLPPGVHDYGGNLIGQRFVEDVVRLNVYERASGYRGPVLILHGTQDLAVPPAVSQRFRDEVYGGRAELVWVDEADHTFSQFAWEQKVVQSACEFLVR